MKYVVGEGQCRDYPASSREEWLLPNGLGGYAMGTASGANLRRYHGHLVAATKPPAARMVLLAAIEAYCTHNGETCDISTNQYSGAVHPLGYQRLKQFSAGRHVEWQYDIGGGAVLAKRLKMHPGVNAVTVEYCNRGPNPVQLTLRPLVCHKSYHDNFRVADYYPEFLIFPEDKTMLSHQSVLLVLDHPGAERTPTTGWYYRFEYTREVERGLDPIDDLYCPCELRYIIPGGESVVLVAADQEDVKPVSFEDEREASTDVEALLSEAAGKFLVKTEDRTSIIAGYPWFTDWGRDTMVSLPGICLERGLLSEAKDILFSYAAQMRNGIIPNRFVDRGETPEYNTVDATLWFAHAIHQTLEKEWDAKFAKAAFKWLTEVHKWHVQGTEYGIHVDPADGLLSQGAEGVQLTWMDAKVDGWVVTPRHGKPVEVNGLWVNFLHVMAWLAEKTGGKGAPFAEEAARAEKSFKAKFWHEMTGHYLDTVEPDDATLRPNQLIAMSLPFGPACGPEAVRALDKVTEKLLTPHGLRTLGPDEPGYKGRYEGPMPARDAAYHQGTVWPWLLGPYCDALLKLKGDKDKVARIAKKSLELLTECGLGGVSEVYDGDEPQRASGCPYQAWSVAELLRVAKMGK